MQNGLHSIFSKNDLKKWGLWVFIIALSVPEIPSRYNRQIFMLTASASTNHMIIKDATLFFPFVSHYELIFCTPTPYFRFLSNIFTTKRSLKPGGAGMFLVEKWEELSQSLIRKFIPAMIWSEYSLQMSKATYLPLLPWRCCHMPTVCLLEFRGRIRRCICTCTLHRYIHLDFMMNSAQVEMSIFQQGNILHYSLYLLSVLFSIFHLSFFISCIQLQ